MDTLSAGEVLDVAIVGGGAAGAYAFHRLCTDDTAPKRSVHLFEATSDIGGRIRSLPSTDPELSAPVELGAMRYLSHQVLIQGLIKRLGFSTRVRPHRYTLHGYHLRGDFIHYNDGDPALRGHSPRFNDVYRVDQCERQLSPQDLVIRAIARAMSDVKIDTRSGADGMASDRAREITVIEPLKQKLRGMQTNGREVLRSLSNREWDVIRERSTLGEVPLSEVSFWHVLQHYLSSEAFHLVRDGFGYYTVLSEWNAADAFAWVLKDFAPGVEYRTLDCGLQVLPKRCITAGLLERERRYPQDPRCDCSMECEVHSVKWYEREQYFELEVVPTSSGGGDQLYANQENESPRIVWARHVILAVSAQALGNIELIDVFPTAPELDAFRQNVSQSVPRPLQKIVLAYRNAWWRDHRWLESPRGKILTDLPLRQVYFTEDAETGAGWIMIYDDGLPLRAWEAVQRLEETKHDRALFLPSLPTKENAGLAKRLVGKIHSLLGIILQVDEGLIPEPISGSMATWDETPLGAAWYTWAIGARSQVLRTALVRPSAGCPIAVCGESLSGDQGWIEGALKTVEIGLEELGLVTELPAWPGEDKGELERLLEKTGSETLKEYLRS